MSRRARAIIVSMAADVILADCLSDAVAKKAVENWAGHHSDPEFKAAVLDELARRSAA